MTFRRPLAIVAMLVALLAAGCTDEAGGNANPTDSPTNDTAAPDPTTTDANGGGPEIPRVENPLDADAFADDPCALIDQDVVDQIGEMGPLEADLSEAQVNAIGPTCRAVPLSGSRLGLSVWIGIPNRDAGGQGLTDVYRGLENGLVDYVEPVEIPGYPEYPAVFSGHDDQRADGEHGLALAVADDLLINISVGDKNNPDIGGPAAVQLAASVLDNLKQGR